MDGIAVFLIVAMVIGLMVSIIMSVVYMIAMYKLFGYLKMFLESKE